MAFISSPAKDLIRTRIDKELVSRFSSDQRKTLNYFGLCGPEMSDILEWRDYLDSYTAVEFNDSLKRQRLLDTAYSVGLYPRLELLSGDIDRIMIDWHDEYGMPPARTSYEIVNLDYQGGIAYKDLGGDSRRITAIKRMIERQADRKQNFLLLTTVNTRNKSTSEFDIALTRIGEEAAQWGKNLDPIIDWYRKQRYDQKLKVYVPYFLNQMAYPLRYSTETLAVISYIGTGSRMVHFAFKFTFQPDSAAVGKKEPILGILKKPLLEIEGEKIIETIVPREVWR
jgi:hypothetical protein